MEQQPHAEIWARDVGNWLNCGLRESKRTRRARANPDAAAVHVAEVVKRACLETAGEGEMIDLPLRVRYDKDTSDAVALKRALVHVPRKMVDWLTNDYGSFGLRRRDDVLRADFAIGGTFRVRFRAQVEAIVETGLASEKWMILEVSCAERPPTQALAKLAMTAWLWEMEKDQQDLPDVNKVGMIWAPRDRAKEVQLWTLGYEAALEHGSYVARMAATHARDQMPTPGHFCQYCPVRECVLRAVEE